MVYVILDGMNGLLDGVVDYTDLIVGVNNNIVNLTANNKLILIISSCVFLHEI